MKLLVERFKISLIYFIYYPDKTSVIITVYILNPLFSFIEKIINKFMDFVRQILLFFISVNSKK